VNADDPPRWATSTSAGSTPQSPSRSRRPARSQDLLWQVVVSAW